MIHISYHRLTNGSPETIIIVSIISLVHTSTPFICY